MEIGEASAGGDSSDDDKPVRGYRLVDIYGRPVADVTVKLSSGVEHRTDADGCVEDDDLEGGVSLQTADGRKVIFGFPYYQPVAHDPGWIRHSLEDFDDSRRNGMFEDEDEDAGPT